MAFEPANAQDLGDSLMWRDDPIDEPWYELNFKMKRWTCPGGLPSPLVEDIIEAIQDLDHVLLESMKLVDRFAYGLESSKKRFIKESSYEVLRGEFELAEDQFLVARAGFSVRWKSVLTTHARQIAVLPKEVKQQLIRPEVDYGMEYTVSKVALDDHLKQFLKGIHPDKERFIATGLGQ